MPRNPVGDIPPELLEALLDNPYESQILVDAQGVVRYLSTSNEPFYRVEEGQALGRHILELNADSELTRVLQTGRAEMGRLFRLRGKERIIARIPLRDAQGNIVGAVGKLMFWHPEKARQLLRQVQVLENRLDYYQKELQEVYRSQYALERLVGESPAMQEARKVAAQAAASDLPVLITGETGTGKEVLAHAIHQLSPRGDHPLVKVNCASIPHELFESELFGYEAGAFTGASKKGKPGKFELAEGGTIFLDEVGDLPLPSQVKLLRVIQEHEVERVGGTRTLRLDFRVIAATNRDLKSMLASGQFRQDLYYRLNIFAIKTPPLRSVRQDIPRLARHLLENLPPSAAGQAQGPLSITPEALECLMAHDWPGNVRELRNVLQRAASVAGEGPLALEHLPLELRQAPPAPAPETPAGPLHSLREELELAERRALERALAAAQGNRSLAARLLGIHRTGLYQKLRRHGLEARQGQEG